jgi:hypothetical protein
MPERKWFYFSDAMFLTGTAGEDVFGCFGSAWRGFLEGFFLPK